MFRLDVYRALLKSFFFTLLGLFPFLETSSQGVTELIFPSKYLLQNRKIFVSVPAHYADRKDSLHLILLLDGNNKTLFDLTVASKRFLETNAVDLNEFNAPASIIVGIEQKDRSVDFIDSAATFSRFLTEEIIPYLKSHYRIIPYTVLIGHSLGGRFALQSLLQRPDLFTAVITASPAFSDEWSRTMTQKLDSIFSNTNLTQHAWFFSTSYQSDDNTEAQFRRFAEHVREHFSKKQLSRLDVGFESFTSFGHAKTPFLTIPDGLHFIYSPAKWYFSKETRKGMFKGNYNVAATLKSHSDSIRSRFGVGFDDQRWQLLIAYQFSASGRKTEAIDVLINSITLNLWNVDHYSLLLQLLKETNDKRLAHYQRTFQKIISDP